jgi:CDP-diacylglycerol---glycerol-3-phosphate 3-phosphatidyltransferase
MRTGFYTLRGNHHLAKNFTQRSHAERSLMLTNKLRVQVNRVTMPLGRVLGTAGLTANALTVTGTVITGVASLLVAVGSPVAAAWVLLVGSLFDMLDGAVARSMGTKSLAGAFLDSTLDRVSDGMLFAALAWNQTVEGSRVGLALALGTGLLAFLTSYIRAKAESLDLTCTVGIAERWLRIALVGVGLAFHLLLPTLGLLLVLSLVTVVHRFSHVFRKAASL